jgi:peptide/nickel transport system ATP-binding protein
LGHIDAVSPGPLGAGVDLGDRCPKAFGVCGWESRDLRTLFEDRWTRLSQDDYQRERANVGELDLLDEPTTEALLPAPEGGDDPAEVLEAMRAAAPDDPFWKGVAETEITDVGVRVRFREPIEPRGFGLSPDCPRPDSRSPHCPEPDFTSPAR